MFGRERLYNVDPADEFAAESDQILSAPFSAQRGYGSSAGRVVQLNPQDLQKPGVVRTRPQDRTPPRPFYNPNNYGRVLNLPFSISAVSQVVLTVAPNIRKYLLIENTHPTQSIFVSFGAPATVFNGYQIFPNGGFFEWLNFVPQDAVNIIANGAATTCVILHCSE